MTTPIQPSTPHPQTVEQNPQKPRIRRVFFPDNINVQAEQERITRINYVSSNTILSSYFSNRTPQELRLSREQAAFYKEIDRYFIKPKTPKKQHDVYRVIYTVYTPQISKEESKCCTIL